MSLSINKKVVVVGAGLAGVEAANYLANCGVKVYLYESKRIQKTPAQKSDFFAELVCTNSLKSKDPNSAHGILKNEMNSLGSLVLESAKETAVPAGNALSVDREKFGKLITHKLKNNPNIEIINEIVENPLDVQSKHSAEAVVIATGPLTLKPLESWIQEYVSNDDLYFYDAIAPIVDVDSLDLKVCYFKNRYENDLENADYLNVPLNQDQYLEFVDDILGADLVLPKDFEDPKFFESCLPIDVMAKRGVDTLRFSCMKPVGLEKNGELPYAVIQLRKENLEGSSYNMVGFQNRLKYGEQVRIFKKLPGFENAVFNHLGSVHRNTYLHSAKILNHDFSMRKNSEIYFAGQISGVEGYTESAAMGLFVAHQMMRKFQGQNVFHWPKETAIGALVNYVLTAPKPRPSNINFGLLPKVELNREQRRNKKRKLIKKELAALRAKKVLTEIGPEISL